MLSKAYQAMNCDKHKTVKKLVRTEFNIFLCHLIKTVLDKEKIIHALAKLGKNLGSQTADLNAAIELSYAKNSWFTGENVRFCLNNWSKTLTLAQLTDWTNELPQRNESPKSVGIIMAGNIPLVGLHDLLCVLVAGHKTVVKLAQNDEVLMKYCINQLITIEPALKDSIEITERVVKPDAIIATGSNNSARYFDYYFRDIPNIIRKNRTSVAVITGEETKKELELLSNDIFQYFGLGCRNVTKLLVPKDYDLVPLLDATAKWSDVQYHNKYANNTTYHRAIFLMNLTPHLDTGYLLVKEDEKLHSPLSCVFYQRFENENDILTYLKVHKDEIQVIVSSSPKFGQAFGTTQATTLTDYADGVDTLAFLSTL